MADSGSSGGTVAPRAGAGPTVIAGALVVLVIGLGWLNHGGAPAGDGRTPFARDVARAIEDVDPDGEIPASAPATPSRIGSSGGAGGGHTATTVVIDPETGLEVTINVPDDPAAGSSATTGDATGTTNGSGGSTPTTRPGGGTTTPTSSGTTSPPTSNTTAPPTTATTSPPTTDTTLPTIPPQPGLVGGVTRMVGKILVGA